MLSAENRPFSPTPIKDFVVGTQHLLLIRHGETEWNRQKRYVGATDLPISEVGQKQAKQLAKNYSPPADARLFCSPLLRARMTAAIVAPHHDAEIVNNLRELSFGLWEGSTAKEIEEKWPGELGQMWQWNRAYTLTGGDNLGDFEQGVKEVTQLLLSHETETIIAVCHGGLIRLILCQLLDLPFCEWSRFHIAPASLAQLSIHDGRATLQGLSGTGGALL